jgi:hypothetical protein
MDYDNYFVECVRDEAHGERFVIWLASLAEGQMKRTIGPLTENQLRSELEKMGLTPEAEDLIRRARKHAEAESEASQPAGA